MIIPPFCPNPDCPLHFYGAAEAHGPFWARTGYYHTKVSGAVQRFRCSICGQGFSERTWSIDYFTKKSFDYKEIQRALNASESVSAIARHLGCSFDSVQNRIDRLGRNGIALHARLLQDHCLREDLGADGFESFDRSQFFPNAINLLVGTQSQFLYGLTHSTLRRKGRMTKSQKRTRAEYDKLYRPAAGSLCASFKSMLEIIEPIWDRRRKPVLILKTDEHKAYPIAMQRIALFKTALAEGSFKHEQYSSEAPRGTMNPLFPVNYYDRELRKDMAAFHRESTCFTRNVSNGLLRVMGQLVWHNYLKPHRIVHTAEKPEVHAVVAGIPKEAIAWELERLYAHRAFLSQQVLSDEMKKTWLKMHKTPLKKESDYCQKFARAGELHASRN